MSTHAYRESQLVEQPAWTGIGAVGIILLGILLFGEPASASRLACAGLIVAGIVGLKLLAPE